MNCIENWNGKIHACMPSLVMLLERVKKTEPCRHHWHSTFVLSNAAVTFTHLLLPQSFIIHLFSLTHHLNFYSYAEHNFSDHLSILFNQWYLVKPTKTKLAKANLIFHWNLDFLTEIPKNWSNNGHTDSYLVHKNMSLITYNAIIDERNICLNIFSAASLPHDQWSVKHIHTYGLVINLGEPIN